MRSLLPLYGLMGIAQFEPAKTIVLKNEGGYFGNLQGRDKGGETYRGIARNFHSNWAGWTIIDFYKTRFGAIPEGAFIGNLRLEYSSIDTHLVPDFYEGLWRKSRAGELNNQALANLYFDFFIHSSGAVGVIQQVLNASGQNLVLDNRIGPKTIGAMNAINPNQLHDAIKMARASYIDDLVNDGRLDPSFYKGIQTRIAKFPNLAITSSPGTNQTLIGFGVLALGLAAFFYSEHLTNRIKANDK